MPQDKTNQLPPEIQKMLSEQLRDVHLPDAISWWPLAWGWWVLIGLILITGITALVLTLHKRAQNRYRSIGTTSLESAYAQWTKDQNTQAYLYQSNDILKRCMLHVSGSTSLTSQSGQAWVDQLHQWSKRTFSDQAQTALAFDCYKANPSSDVPAIHKELIQWLKNHHYQPESKAAAINKGTAISKKSANSNDAANSNGIASDKAKTEVKAGLHA